MNPHLPSLSHESSLTVKGKLSRNPLRGEHSDISSFTLVEMIVSMAILSILSLLLVTMLGQVSQGWATVRTQMDTRQNGRNILTQMASDIRLAALPLDRTNTNSLQFVINPSSIATNSSTDTNYFYPQAVFFQAPIATDTSKGNMAEVGYYIRWDTSSNTNNPHAVLCRYFVNPGTNSIAEPNYLIYSSPQAWLPKGSGLGSVDSVSPLPAASNNYKGIVADNVIALWVRCLDLSGYAVYQDSGVTNSSGSYTKDNVGYNFNSRQGFIQTYYGVGGHSGYSATLQIGPKGCFSEGALVSTAPFIFTQSLPYAVEIAVVVLDSRTASLITGVTAKSATSFPITGTLASGNPYAAASLNSTNADPLFFWNEVNAFVTNLPPRIQKGARVYSTRVQLVNGVY